MNASIISIGTAVPEHTISQSEIKETVKRMFGTQIPQIDRMLTIFENSGINRRHLCQPLEWYLEAHDVQEKHALFVRHATDLAERAVLDCLRQASVSPADVDHIIFVTTTGHATPSIDAHLCNRLGFRRNLKRTPIWGLGCAGGAAGLSRASEYVQAFPQHVCLLVSVELCSLTFIRGDLSKSNIVATSLFADGAAAALIAGTESADRWKQSRHPRVAATQSTIWPDSLGVMGWEVMNDGLKVIFSKHIPSIVSSSILTEVESLLESNGLRLPQIRHFALHPGGMKVLRAYESALGMNVEALSPSASVLRSYGNMSSCTILFVLQEILKSSPVPPEGEYGIAGALGPGFSSELLLLQF